MNRVGPGSNLGGRYVMRRRLAGNDTSSTWQAHDETLDRLVHLRVLAADHPRGEAVLDAARRAAALEDPRLVRVLDVGQEDDATFVVTEWIDADSLESQLRDGPLAADTARTVVGEVALALEAARHRGLHHLRLSPRRVRILDDGTVKLTGLAIAAGLDGVEVGDGADELSSEAATELDTRDLVAVAYAALTATWPLPDGSDLPEAPQVAGQPVAPSQIVTGAPADLDTLCAQTFAGAGAPDSPGDLARQIAPWGRQRQDARASGTFPHLLPPTKRAAGPAAPDQPEQPTTAPEPTTTSDAESTGAAANPTGSLPAVPATSLLPVVAARWDSEFADVDDDPIFANAQPAGPDADRWAEDVVPGGVTTGPLRDDEGSRTGTVLVLVGGFVVVFLLLAYCGLRGLGSNAFVPSDSGAGTPSASVTPSPTGDTASGTPTTPSATSTAAGAPVSVVSARGFDPQGDGSEKDSDAARAIDGKTSTAWVSDTYKSAQFGGLKKGVGLLLDLGGQHEVTSVAVRVGAAGATIELRTASGDTLGPVLATVQDASGTITLKPAQPVQADNLVLWFSVPAAVDGGYRAEVAEVKVR